MKCNKCGSLTTKLSWLKEKDGWCSACFHEGVVINISTMIATDSIPGGLEIKHGLCNPDGTPRKYYSKSDIKEAAYNTGWTISGDTPKPNPRLQDAKKLQEEKSKSGSSRLYSR